MSICWLAMQNDRFPIATTKDKRLKVVVQAPNPSQIQGTSVVYIDTS
jgi:hypothetical protein